MSDGARHMVGALLAQVGAYPMKEGDVRYHAIVATLQDQLVVALHALLVSLDTRLKLGSLQVFDFQALVPSTWGDLFLEFKTFCPVAHIVVLKFQVLDTLQYLASSHECSIVIALDINGQKVNNSISDLFANKAVQQIHGLVGTTSIAFVRTHLFTRKDPFSFLSHDT